MKRKNLTRFSIIFLTAMLAFLVCTAFAADGSKWREGIDEAGAERRTGQLYPLPVQETPTDGYLTVATASLTIVASSATIVGTLPTGTHVLEIGAMNGVLNYGGSTIGNSTSPWQIASGASVEFKVATLTPRIYLRTHGAGDASATIRAR